MPMAKLLFPIRGQLNGKTTHNFPFNNRLVLG
jgi:hypothetical protein